MDTNNESVNSIHNRNKRFNPQNIFQSFFRHFLIDNNKNENEPNILPPSSANNLTNNRGKQNDSSNLKRSFASINKSSDKIRVAQENKLEIDADQDEEEDHDKIINREEEEEHPSKKVLLNNNNSLLRTVSVDQSVVTPVQNKINEISHSNNNNNIKNQNCSLNISIDSSSKKITKNETGNLKYKDKKLDSILNRTLSDSILNKKSSSSSSLGITSTFKKAVGLSRKNSSNRRSIFSNQNCSLNLFNRSTSNILARKNFLSPSASPSSLNFGGIILNGGNHHHSSTSSNRSLKKHPSHSGPHHHHQHHQHHNYNTNNHHYNTRGIQHHRSIGCVLNTSFTQNEKISFHKKKFENSSSSPISTPLSESPITMVPNLSTPPLLLDNNGSGSGDSYHQHLSHHPNKRLPSSPRLHLTPATSSFNQKMNGIGVGGGLINNPYSNQSLLITSFKNSDARRWSFASMNSSSGYGTNTPSNHIGGESSNSNQSLQYSSNEKLTNSSSNKPKNSSNLVPNSVSMTPERIERKNSIDFNNQISTTSGSNKYSLCGNLNCQNCSTDLFTDKIMNHANIIGIGGDSSASSSTANMIFLNRQSSSGGGSNHHNHHRICSSNDSIQLEDDSSEVVGFSSPNSFNRQRARSLSCSPSKSHNDSDIIILHNEKFKEKYPKACTQMEENLQSFIDTNKHLNHSEQKQLDPAARFIHNQIIEIAKLCLDKSRANQLTCAYFDEITNSLDKLLFESKDKCSNDDCSIDYLRNFVKKFLLIVSRVARLLECLEFDPLEFCHLLDAAEEQAKQFLKTDIPKFIISKLGLNRDPFEEIVSADESSSSSSSSSNENSTSIKKTDSNNSSDKRNQIAPTEADFEQIKLISNGAYGAVYLVRHKQLKNERFAMKKIKKHNLVLRNQLQQVFTERDIMVFTDNPFVVSLVCTFETKKYLCMVMEYVEGGDVATLIKKIGPLGVEMARQYFAETTLAVEYLHNYGIIHRDLKPDNLLITAQGHIKLTDFGLSKIGLMNLTTNFYEGNNLKNFMKDHYCKEFNDKQICGTPQYLAPEVILRQRYGKAVDWWSMGIILYEFLTSIPPFNGNTPEDLFENVINGEILWPEADDELIKIPYEAKDLILGLLRHDPLKRLGAGGSVEIKEHDFFFNLNWNQLLDTKGDFIPQLDSPDDTSYFDQRRERYNHESDSPPQQSLETGGAGNSVGLGGSQSQTTTYNNETIIDNNSNTLKSKAKKMIAKKLKTSSDSNQLADILDKKLQINITNTPKNLNENNNDLLLIDDTDNELFASFSSCSSKFRLGSVSNTNSPVFMNENRKSLIHNHHHLTKSNSFVSIGATNNLNKTSNHSSRTATNCELFKQDDDNNNYSSLPIENTQK